MPIYKTKGIILKRRHINEADRLLTTLTEKQGKVTVIAKGVRKTLSKLGSHLEPYNLVDLVLSEGRNFDTVTGATVDLYFKNIHKDLDKMGRASRFGELIDLLLHDKEEHVQLFWLFKECLEFLDENDNRLIDLYFFINCLSLLGYCPELYECTFCRQQIKEFGIGWNDEHGGVVCNNCANKAKLIDPQIVKLFRIFLEKKVTVINRLTLDKKIYAGADAVIFGFVSFINQKELNCDKFLRNLS